MLLSEFQNGLCFYCDTPLGNDKTVDEFIPRALSGVREMRNSVVCHHDCNNAKGCRMPTSKEAAKLFRTRAESDRFPISQEIKNLAMPALAREQKRAAGS